MPIKRPTIADVAARAGVSKGAVSFALNGRDGVSPETRDRILAVARELGWTPSLRARSLSTSRALAVGLVLARDPALLGADPFFPAFIAGVETSLAPAGYALLLQVVPDEESELAAYRSLAAQGRVDGVFLTDLRIGDPRVAALAELPMAATTLNRPDIACSFPAVVEDDATGLRALVAHLVELGHRRIAHVSGPLHFLHSRHRHDAWRAALADAGLAADQLVISDFTAAGGAAATRQLLDAHARPSAIVYANDLMALAGLSTARARGVSVPQELSICGFGGSELAGVVHPALTTVLSDPVGWGKAAATVLLESINGRPDVADIQLPPLRVALRESTAPAPPEQ